MNLLEIPEKVVCNFETYTFTSRNGTHTECIGHITEERISILTCLNDELIPATFQTKKKNL